MGIICRWHSELVKQSSFSAFRQFVYWTHFDDFLNEKNACNVLGFDSVLVPKSPHIPVFVHRSQSLDCCKASHREPQDEIEQFINGWVVVDRN